MNILFIDTETTGTDPNRHSVIQIAAQLHSDRKVVESFNERVSQDNPEVDLNALRVNKVSFSQLGSYGNPEKTVVKNFVDFLLYINSKYRDIYICGHNVNFDVNFITKMLGKHGITSVGNLLPYRALDTSTIGLFLNTNEVGLLKIQKFNSQNLFKHLSVNVKEEELHDAMNDVKATAEAFYKMQDMVKALPNRFDTILQHKQSMKDYLDYLETAYSAGTIEGSANVKTKFEQIYSSLFSDGQPPTN